MRPPLENIEFIENYILGNFDPSEHEIAKRRIESSPELSQLLETQQCIYSATRRKVLRAEIQSYAPTTAPSFFQQHRNWFIGGLAVLAVILSIIVFNSDNFKKKQTFNSTTTPVVSDNEQDITPWIPFDKQYFDFVAEKGATIEGKDGTLILLAGNSLIDANGNGVRGKVRAELIEAIDWEDMLAYNLTTTSDGKALSSGGMMRIRYHQNNKEVFVNPERPMHVEIPTDNYNPEMKVWEGEVQNEQLNWKNPQEIERYLTTVDLRQLDFIPEGFDAEVAAILPYNGHTSLSNRLVDSLYYSVARNRTAFSSNQGNGALLRDCHFDIPVREDVYGHPRDQAKPLLKGRNSVTGQVVSKNGKPIAGMTIRMRMDRYLEHEEEIVTDENGYFTFDKFYPGEVTVYASLHSGFDTDVLWRYCMEETFECPKSPKNYTLKEPLVAEYTSKINFDRLSVLPKTNGSFIDPLTVKTLKTSRFQNTFIATREFEQRLQIMHRLKNGSQLLQMYILNISDPLWKSDEKAAQLLSGGDKEIFERFAAQRLTNVRNSGIHQTALTKYYTDQLKAFRKENTDRLTEYQTKTEAEIEDLKSTLDRALGNSTELASAQARRKNRSKSTSSSYIGTYTEVSNFSVRTDSYSFSWTSNSWCNIDRYLAAIGSSPLTTSIRTNMPNQGVIVYKTIRELQSIIGLMEESGTYNSLYSRSGNNDEVVCVAMHRDRDSSEQLYYGYSSFDPKTTRNSQLDLAKVSDEEFYTQLCLLSPSESLVAKKLRAEHTQLASISAIKAKLASFDEAMSRARNKISSDVIVYNRLFDFLNNKNNSLIQ